MKRYLLFLLLAVSAGCSSNTAPENQLPLDSILNAGENVRIGEKTYILNTYLYRDFMPVIPPGGNGLIAIANVETNDKSPADSGIDPYEIYILNKGTIYSSFFTDESKPPLTQYPYRIERIMRNGPMLETGILVDVVVKIKYGNRDYFLKAYRQSVYRTD